MTNTLAADRYKALRLLGALAGLSVALGACTYTTAEIVTVSPPNDYRLRHPIAIEEADRSIVVFVGQSRGGLSAAQRADVMGLARVWVSEGTGAIVADVPIGPARLRRVGRYGVATVLAARGFAGAFGRTDLLSKGSTSARFRSLDRRYFSPLCLALATGAAVSRR